MIRITRTFDANGDPLDDPFDDDDDDDLVQRYCSAWRPDEFLTPKTA